MIWAKKSKNKRVPVFDKGTFPRENLVLRDTDVRQPRNGVFDRLSDNHNSLKLLCAHAVVKQRLFLCDEVFVVPTDGLFVFVLARPISPKWLQIRFIVGVEHVSAMQKVAISATVVQRQLK